jgi:hypothetical protein
MSLMSLMEQTAQEISHTLKRQRNDRSMLQKDSAIHVLNGQDKDEMAYLVFAKVEESSKKRVKAVNDEFKVFVNRQTGDKSEWLGND